MSGLRLALSMGTSADDDRGDGVLELSPLERAQTALANGTLRRLDNMYSTVLASPMTVLILLLIITAFFTQQGLSFQDQIDDDVEIFLPEGAPSTELLLEVEKEWSTDIAIIYVQTENAFDTRNTVNITSEEYLREISWVEGDDHNLGGDSTGRGIDYDKNDIIEHVKTLLRGFQFPRPQRIHHWTVSHCAFYKLSQV